MDMSKVSLNLLRPEELALLQHYRQMLIAKNPKVSKVSLGGVALAIVASFLERHEEQISGDMLRQKMDKLREKIMQPMFSDKERLSIYGEQLVRKLPTEKPSVALSGSDERPDPVWFGQHRDSEQTGIRLGSRIVVGAGEELARASSGGVLDGKTNTAEAKAINADAYEEGRKSKRPTKSSRRHRASGVLVG